MWRKWNDPEDEFLIKMLADYPQELYEEIELLEHPIKTGTTQHHYMGYYRRDANGRRVCHGPGLLVFGMADGVEIGQEYRGHFVDG